MKNINENEVIKKHSSFQKVFLFLIPICIISLFLGRKYLNNVSLARSAVDNKEIILTNQYSEMVGELIIEFEEQWNSYAMQKQPQQYLDLLTIGPYFDFFSKLYENERVDESEYLIVSTNIDLVSLRIVDFTSENIKVVACLRGEYTKVDHSQTVIEKFSSWEKKNDYDFFFDVDRWKLGYILDITHPDDAIKDLWYLNEETKLFLGNNIETYISKSCSVP